MPEDNKIQCKCRMQSGPRGAELKKTLSHRVSRIAGQLNGIARMIEDDRCCSEILTQIAAIESALAGVGNILLDEHIKTCVANEVAQGKTSAVDRTLELMRKLR